MGEISVIFWGTVILSNHERGSNYWNANPDSAFGSRLYADIYIGKLPRRPHTVKYCMMHNNVNLCLKREFAKYNIFWHVAFPNVYRKNLDNFQSPKFDCKIISYNFFSADNIHLGYHSHFEPAGPHGFLLKQIFQSQIYILVNFLAARTQ